LSETTNSILPSAIVLAPWLSLPAALLWRRVRPGLARAVHVATPAIALLLMLPLYPGIMGGEILHLQVVEMAPGINLAFRIDALGFYFGLLLAVLWLLAGIYSLGYIHTKETRYYTFLAMNLSFCLGIVYSANMFTLFIFYELMGLFAFPLIIHTETEKARRAGTKYLAYTVSAGAVLLAAMILQSHYGETLSFLGGGVFGASQAGRTALLALFGLYMAAFGVKACIMPLHGWVPDAHPAAPAPASALLSGVILKMGIFGMVRVAHDVFGLDLLRGLGVSLPMMVISGFTILAASLYAITQDDLKRRLAYSSVAQVSYIILGLFMLSPADGTVGGLLHVAHHAFMKGTLFLCAGIIVHETGKHNVSELNGIGRRIPLTMAAFSLAALGMLGMPVTCGFISKWLLGLGAVSIGQAHFIAVLMLSSLLNAVYFLPIVYAAFFREGEFEKADGLETSRKMLVPVLICAAFVIILGLLVTLPGLPHSLVSIIVRGLV